MLGARLAELFDLFLNFMLKLPSVICLEVVLVQLLDLVNLWLAVKQSSNLGQMRLTA